MYYWHSWSEKKKKFSRAILSTNVRFIWLNFELLRVLNLIFCCQNTDVESKWQGNAQIGQKDNYVHTCLLKLATMTKGLFTFQEVIVNIRLFQTFFFLIVSIICLFTGMKMRKLPAVLQILLRRGQELKEVLQHESPMLPNFYANI